MKNEGFRRGLAMDLQSSFSRGIHQTIGVPALVARATGKITVRTKPFVTVCSERTLLKETWILWKVLYYQQQKGTLLKGQVDPAPN